MLGNHVDVDEVNHYLCDLCEKVAYPECADFTSSEEKCMLLTKRKLRYLCEQVKEELQDVKRILKNLQSGGVDSGPRKTGAYLYSDKLKKQKKVIVIEPSKENTKYEDVRDCLVEKIDPVQLNVDITLAHLKHYGGCLLECNKGVNVKDVKTKIQKDLGKDFTYLYQKSKPSNEG
ncbi:hypothetical protein HHI36_020108 [Cryptolaemus montrouzieri]|uniref:Uncharacterized protein n=1 Tax=Cryptolaemus montrouzieri TaxID=559131 RepID=A0ABD2N9H4_9CUCU